MELIGTQPKICYVGRMVPICGRSFWADNNGARLFCKMLGKADGIVEKFGGETLTEDAYIVGRCSAKDTKLTRCTAKCNQRTLGGNCSHHWGEAFTCSKGSKGGANVTCFGKICHIFLC